MDERTAVPPYCPNCGAQNPPQAASCFACGQSLAASAGAVAPASVPVGAGLLKGRYRLVRPVGQGGFGAVYQAEDTQLGDRLVAIKEMSQRGLTPEELTEATEAFHQEALLLAKLTHPNLPRIYEQFSEGGRWYLVMDFLEGETLEARLSKATGGRLPVKEVLRLGIQLCTVLEYLHTRQPPIIFRDLKPTNVMLTPAGQVYLIDFGIARLFKPGQTRDTVAFGSAGYAAPEQYGKAQTTTQSDMYSLGATLHHLLSGNDPANSPFVFAPLHLAGLPELEALVGQMLQPEQAKRPASMAVVRAELQRLADDLAHGQTGSGRMAPSVPKAALASRAAPTPLASAYTLSLLPETTLCTYRGHSAPVKALTWSPDGRFLASGSVDGTIQVWDGEMGTKLYSYDEHGRGITAVAWAPNGHYIASGDGSRGVRVWDGSLADVKIGTTRSMYSSHASLLGQVLSLAWSPDSARLAFGRRDGRIALWDVKTGSTLLNYKGHYHWLGDGGILALAWSPNGARIASGGHDLTVRVWTPTSGETVCACVGHSKAVTSVAWSPDRQWLASASYDQSVRVWDVATGDNRFIIRTHSDDIYAVAWSPDGQWLASASHDQTVQLWELASQSQRYVYRGHAGPVFAVAWSPDGKRLASASHDRTVQVWQPDWRTL